IPVEGAATRAEPPAWPYCYQCDGPTVGACARCGRCFCARHGGERFCWRSAGGGQRGPVLPRRPAPRRGGKPPPLLMGVSIGVLVALGLAGGLTWALWLLPRFAK